ncbi:MULTISPECIES: hydantoinase/oxoprolinase family protein [unclassified Bradyrhizobium]|uniref:hydantoinase/oxoprolinase family protein n=1 Tax=unclassified Bradyrhizobium TaxID=2631580 RepID=UPI0024785DCB|nr:MULTISPECIES: hydantoinase/oxoprolinase family protein [unclassified Bradyrhizobium]WGS19187.1 hydantoinase/oxoprolinase family protein [Bradyrhizobium sp. ISRA463]WGS26022.1 hydantoinase/oxoprolinase family protein [Bradyrhizobium sp. ISRA464]
MGYRVSVDTGGTFTDVVVADANGNHTVGKALTTHDRIFEGMRKALAAAAEELGFGLEDLLSQSELLIYGTTRSTNAIVTRKVAKTAFLTTKGFPDTLVLKEGGKYNPHDFSVAYPEPYIPRRYTFEITERVSSEGEVLVPLDPEQAVEILRTLKHRNFEAVAVSFLWSITNPVNEQAMGELIETVLPGIPYTLSHRLIPIVREYRRASATAIDASLKPLMQTHLKEMEEDLRAAGYHGEILVSTSVGGCMHVAEVIEKPIHTAKSGPAMAPVAGLTYSEMEGLGNNVVVCDTGGTTFDVGLVRDGRLVYSRETWLGPQWTGHLLSISSVDVRSVGAGGGSIAWIDSGGLLRIGPHSAGSDPGPACYGAGGQQPTVTDAAVVLGYLDPEFFLGGRMKLDVNAAHRVIGDLAKRMNKTTEETAYSVIQLSSELMIKAVNEITVREGFNPRESTLVAGGGAAGLNIIPIAAELGCEKIVVPKTAGALSACGMQFSDIVAEHTASYVTLSRRFNFEAVNAALQNIDDELHRFLATLAGKGFENHKIEYFVEARYQFQVWELDTALPVRRFCDKADVEALVNAFHEVHERVFAVYDEDSQLECLNWKGRLTVRLPNSVRRDGVKSKAVRTGEPFARRRVYFSETGSVEAPIYKGSNLARGNRITGPAIIEEPTTTIVIYPLATARVSDSDNYILERN